MTRAVRQVGGQFLLVFGLLFTGGAQAAAQALRVETSAPYAFLLDSNTGTVLFEKAADELSPPASMAKLMTAAVLFHELQRGKVKATDEFVVSENAWRKGGAPSRGSTMFLALNSRVAVADLVPGLIVHSGNDAAIVIAEGVAGSEESFARMMTNRARDLGLPKSVFRNSSGLGDPEQKSTARELGLLADHLIKSYPDHYPVFAQREFTWNKVKQQNRNPLLTMDIGADGLKTGNIGDSGFGLVGSAVRDGRRLIVVVNGVSTAKDRAQEARKLLDWGFRSFDARLLFKAGKPIATASVFGGAEPDVSLVAANDVSLLVPRGSQDRIAARVVYTGPLRPPIAKGQQIGRLVVKRGDMTALDIPLQADSDVDQGGLTRRAVDAGFEYGRVVVRKLVGMVRG